MDKQSEYSKKGFTRESLLDDMQKIRVQFFWITAHPLLQDERCEFKKLLDDLDKSIQYHRDVLFIQDLCRDFNTESPTQDSSPSPSFS